MIDSAAQTTNEAAFNRIKARAEAHAALVNEIAKMLWENGEMLADTEGGPMPTWEEVAHQVSNPFEGDGSEFYNSCCTWWADHCQQARALLRLDARASLKLGQILIQSAGEKFEQADMDMWRKLERAKGFEPGSLTGKPGVQQRVAL